VPSAEIPRSSFDRSHGYKTTFDAGLLIPIFVDEALPGDTFNLSMSGFARLATPIYPLMDNMFMDTFFFAVPNRLLWWNWERFNGAQDNPDDSTDFTVPIMSVNEDGSFAAGSIADYFGLPLGVTIGDGAGETEVSALPFRAYWQIWNQWFRDQNLQDSNIFGLNGDDGPDGVTTADLLPLRRGKRHDYFTSCLPWPQKGDAVTMPLGDVAPVWSNEGVSLNSVTGSGHIRMKPAGGSDRNVFIGLGNTQLNVTGANGDGSTSMKWDETQSWASNAGTGLYADLTEATAATINQLRQAFQVQRLLERDARGGTRYTEILRAHFGVTSPDARLQRPEYLGGGSSPVNIVAVPQTSETDAGTPQGNLAAYGTATLHGHGFTKSFTEHCTIIGLVCVRADLTYQQGLERMWSRQTRFDFYWPALSHIGEQSVLRKELVCAGTAADEEVFGYQERYAEYRYKPTRITGLFRSSHPQSLDAWHLSQELTAPATLNEAFIVDDPPIDRVIAVPAEPHFLFDAYFKLRCARPMPMFGVPGMIDHF